VTLCRTRTPSARGASLRRARVTVRPATATTSERNPRPMSERRAAGAGGMRATGGGPGRADLPAGPFPGRIRRAQGRPGAAGARRRVTGSHMAKPAAWLPAGDRSFAMHSDCPKDGQSPGRIYVSAILVEASAVGWVTRRSRGLASARHMTRRALGRMPMG
jgi:hypothetical protein